MPLPYETDCSALDMYHDNNSTLYDRVQPAPYYMYMYARDLDFYKPNYI